MDHRIALLDNLRATTDAGLSSTECRYNARTIDVIFHSFEDPSCETTSICFPILQFTRVHLAVATVLNRSDLVSCDLPLKNEKYLEVIP